IHAARALLAHLRGRQRQDEFLPRLETRLDLLVRPILALDFQEPFYEAHNVDNSPYSVVLSAAKDLALRHRDVEPLGPSLRSGRQKFTQRQPLSPACARAPRAGRA